MLKFFKYTALGSLCFFLLIIAAITIYFTVNDANEFKPTIESQAKEKAGVYLNIKGELAWSLVPLGIKINQLEVLDQNQELFASANQIIAEVDLLSLFKLSPKVQNINIDGLELELIQTKDNAANWTNILPADDSVTPEAELNPSPIEVPKQNDNTNKPIDFLVESFSIHNSKLHFFSEKDAIDITLENIQLAISNIALEQNVPLTLQFDLENKQPELKLNTQLSGSLFASQDLSSFKIQNFESKYQINSMLLGKNTSNAHLKANIKANTKTETIDITKLNLGFENAILDGQVKIENYSNQPSAKGQISLAAFSLKQLLTHLGIALPEMKNTQALNKVSLNATFNKAQEQFDISKLNIQLDESQWLGKFGFSTLDQAVRLKLKGNKINLDDYLPPVSEAAPTPPANNETAKQANIETALLPLETIRALNLDIQIEQDLLLVKQLETSQIKTHITAKDGLLELEQFTGEFYQGNYDIQASIDARSDTPLWTGRQSIQAVELEPIAGIFSTFDYIPTGTLNLEAKQSSTGNTIAQLTQNATADNKVEVKNGTIKNISLNAMACQGLAMLNGNKVDTTQWPQETPFTQLSTIATLKQQKVDSKLTIITSGIKLSGTGKIDTPTEQVDFRAGLYVVGDLGEQACRVNDKFKDISIPVRCKGSIDTPPAELCGLDKTRLGKEIKRAAVKEGKRKANKEIDRALDKHLGKDTKIKKDIKKLFKGLF